MLFIEGKRENCLFNQSVLDLFAKVGEGKTFRFLSLTPTIVNSASNFANLKGQSLSLSPFIVTNPSNYWVTIGVIVASSCMFLSFPPLGWNS